MKDSNIIYPSIEAYLEGLTDEPKKLRELDLQTQSLPGYHMISGRYQGRLLSMLSKLISPRYILEIGTFTGYSALCLAEGLSADGQLVSLEKNPSLQSFHQQYLTDARIQVLYGDAIDHISTFNDKMWDLVFIDADKKQYTTYYEALIDKISPGGILVVDNVLWRGQVALSGNAVGKHAAIVEHLRSFNDMIHLDKRVEQVILPIRDGLSVIRKYTYPL